MQIYGHKCVSPSVCVLMYGLRRFAPWSPEGEAFKVYKKTQALPYVWKRKTAFKRACAVFLFHPPFRCLFINFGGERGIGSQKDARPSRRGLNNNLYISQASPDVQKQKITHKQAWVIFQFLDALKGSYINCCGERGIRTPGTLASTSV